MHDTDHYLGKAPVRNLLALRLGNTLETIELGLMGSLAAPEWGQMELRPVSLDLPVSPSMQRRIAHERLRVDALRGNQTLFVRADELEAAWRWIDSVERAWSQPGTPVRGYPAGSWGPAQAAGFLPHSLTRSRAGTP